MSLDAFRRCHRRPFKIKLGMFFRFLAIGLFLAAPAYVGARTDETELAETLVAIARSHFAVEGDTRSSGQAAAPSLQGLSEVRYDFPSGNRFATFHLTADGAFRQIIINAPNNEPYKKAPDRRAFLERAMELAAPQSSPEERQWAATTLDRNWTQRVQPIPVQIGSYVFGGITVHSPQGIHDKFKITAVEAGATGWKFSSTH